MEAPSSSRRQFLTAIGSLASASWVTLHWPQIALAAEHAGHGEGAAAGLTTALTAAEAAEVDAVAAQIVPGGITREATVINFIDNALGSFWSGQLPAFREGLAEFESGFAAGHGAGQPFSAAPEAEQIAWLKEVDETPFFTAVRRLTVLGLTAMPKYGGNHDGLGWKLIGFVDGHFWEPPFGYYDRDYPGFEPYPGTQPYTAEGTI